MSESPKASTSPEQHQAKKVPSVADDGIGTADNAIIGGDIVAGNKNVTNTAGDDLVEGDKIQPGRDYIRVEPGGIVMLGPTAAQPTTDEPPASGEAPFKGLQFFGERDAHLFFGRELLTARLVGQLYKRSFLAIVGASGSGKSSLVRAGMIPALRSGGPLPDDTLPPAESTHWLIHTITPTAHPLRALAASLTQHSESVTATATLLDDLARDPRSLDLASARLLSATSARRLLLVVDQFEELFTACRDPAEQRQFVDNLLTAAALDTEGVTTTLITLRADFYAHCFQFDRLRAALEQGQVTVGPMTEDELRRTIEEPSRLGGWEFQPGLVDLILADVGREPGALPLLSHALLGTWQRRRGHTLTLDGYREAGGVSGAIARTADNALKALSAQQKVIARNIFLRLTELGEGTQDTRRRAALSELILQPGDEVRVAEVLKVLTDANVRLLIADRDPDGKEVIEVAHEALIREWGTLREWLTDNREGIRLHRHLTESALAWEKLGRDTGELYRGARLAQAVEWAGTHAQAMNALESAFLDASQAWQVSELEVARRRTEQLQRRSFYLIGALVILAGAVVLACGLAFAAGLLGYQSNQNALESQQNAATALAANTQVVEQIYEIGRQARISSARGLTAAAITSLQSDPERSVLLALQALATIQSVGEIDVIADTEHALSQATDRSHVRLVLSGHTAPMIGVAYSRDGARLAIANFDGTATTWDAATGRQLITIAMHPGVTAQGRTSVIRPVSIAFNPDGTRLATANTDGTVSVWDSANGQEVITLVPGVGVNTVTFSSDGTHLATAGYQGSVNVWDAITGQKVLTLTGSTGGALAVAYASDGKHLATANNDGTATVWDAITGHELSTLVTHRGEVRMVTFSRDGMLLATANDDGTATVWDASAGREVLTLTTQSSIPLFDIAYSPDGQHLAAASADGTVHVWDVVSNQEVLTVAGHTAAVYDIAYSPDGTRLATASGDGRTKVWDIATGREVLRLAGRAQAINAVAYSPDGRRLATAGADGTARVWDVHSGNELLTLVGHSDPVNCVVFSPDGTRLATCSDSSTLIWDADTGELLLALDSHKAHNVAFSPDGSSLATALKDGRTIVWNATTGQQLLELGSYSENCSYLYCPGPNDVAYSADGAFLATTNATHTAVVWDASTGSQLLSLASTYAVGSPLTNISYSSDGARLATASLDGPTQVWDLATGQVAYILTANNYKANDIVFSPDGTRLATGSDDGTATVWIVADGDELATLVGHNDAINGIAYSPDGTQVATASDDGTARVWDVATRQETLAFTARGRESTMWQVAYNWEGTRLATANGDGTANVWDTSTGEELLTLVDHSNLMHIGELVISRTNSSLAVAYSPDGTRLATAGSSGPVNVWDGITGRLVFTITSGTETIAFSPDGTRLATASPNLGFSHQVSVWDAITGQLVLTLSLGSPQFTTIAYSPDWTRLATADEDGTTHVWDATTGQEMLTLTGHSDVVNSIAFSPDGTQVATASNDGTARVWDAVTGQELRALALHGAGSDVTFSPDGTRLATAGADGIARVWDKVTGRELLTLTGHAAGVTGVAFSPDGTKLATASHDGTARLFVGSIEELVVIARSRLTRTWMREECQKYLQMDSCPPTP